MGLDRNLLNAAMLKRGQEKSALVPSDAAAAAMGGGGGGAPPMDPSMMGGGGGGGAPPMDPSMMAGGGGGGAPPGGGDLTAAISTAVQQAMQQSQAGQAGAGGKPPKPDINMVATDVFQIKKLLYALFQTNGWPLPPGLLDGPGRDPSTGAPSSSPTGGSDASGGGGQDQSAIQPVEPMQGAFPGGDDSGKSASAYDWNKVGRVFGASKRVTDNAKTASYMFRRRRGK